MNGRHFKKRVQDKLEATNTTSFLCIYFILFFTYFLKQNKAHQTCIHQSLQKVYIGLGIRRWPQSSPKTVLCAITLYKCKLDSIFRKCGNQEEIVKSYFEKDFDLVIKSFIILGTCNIEKKRIWTVFAPACGSTSNCKTKSINTL